MPVYEYHCNACGKDFEASQRMSDPPLTACTCGSEGQVHRLLSAGNGLIFKGSGFYITDYKNKGGESGSSTSSSSTKTEGNAPAKAPEAPAAPSCGAGACPSCSD